MKRKTSILNVLIVLVIIGAVISGWCALRIFLDYQGTNEEYDALNTAYLAVSQSPAEEKSTSPEEKSSENASSNGGTEEVYFPDIAVDSDALKARNPDYAAWLYMENPLISYPVVHCPTDDYYLHLTFDKEKGYAGCLFIDPDSAANFSDLNVFIYGHNMVNGSMFGKLKALYNNPDGADKHFYLDVMGQHKSYKIFAVVLTDKGSDLFRVPSADEYGDYIAEVLNCASVYCDRSCTEFANKSPIVTLSTCYGMQGTSRRLLIFGVIEK